MRKEEEDPTGRESTKEMLQRKHTCEKFSAEKSCYVILTLPDDP